MEQFYIPYFFMCYFFLRKWSYFLSLNREGITVVAWRIYNNKFHHLFPFAFANMSPFCWNCVRSFEKRILEVTSWFFQVGYAQTNDGPQQLKVHCAIFIRYSREVVITGILTAKNISSVIHICSNLIIYWWTRGFPVSLFMYR